MDECEGEGTNKAKISANTIVERTINYMQQWQKRRDQHYRLPLGFTITIKLLL